MPKRCQDNQDRQRVPASQRQSWPSHAFPIEVFVIWPLDAPRCKLCFVFLMLLALLAANCELSQLHQSQTIAILTQILNHRYALNVL